MGVHKITGCVVQCDICREFLPSADGQGMMVFIPDVNEPATVKARRALNELKPTWIEKNGKVACENCHEEI